MPLGVQLGTYLGSGGTGRGPIMFLAQGNSLSAKDRSGALTLSASGALRYAPGNGGRMNLVPNPSLETNTTFWGAVNSAVISRITTDSMFGSACLQVVTPGSLNGEGVNVSTGLATQLSSPIGDGQTWTGSAYVKAPAGATLSILIEPRLISGAGAGTFSSANFTATGDWQRVSVTRTMSSNTGASRFALWVRTNGAQAITFLVDGAMIEQAASAGAYFDGASAGCAWADPITGVAGTANASPSISKAAFWIEESTTNLLNNPSAEVDATTGISASGTPAGVTNTRDLTYALFGSSSVKSVFDGSIGNQYIYRAGTLSGTGATRTFIGSIYLRGGGNLKVQMQVNYTDTSATISAQTSVTLTDTWQRVVTPTVTCDPAKTLSSCFIHVTTGGVAQAVTFWSDAAQIEEKAYATSYCDGSLGTGYSWSGTAHASASTRSSTLMTTSATGGRINMERGSMVGRFEILVAASGAQYVFCAGDPSAGFDFAGLRSATGAGNIQGLHYINGVAGSVTDGAIGLATFRDGYTEWNGAAIGVRMDAGSMTTGTRNYPITGNLTGKNIQVGTLSGNLHTDGLVGPIAIFDRPLTVAELARLASSDPSGWWSAI